MEDGLGDQADCQDCDGGQKRVEPPSVGQHLPIPGPCGPAFVQRAAKAGETASERVEFADAAIERLERSKEPRKLLTRRGWYIALRDQVRSPVASPRHVTTTAESKRRHIGPE